MQYTFRNGNTLSITYDGEIHIDSYELKEGEHWVTSKEEPKHRFVINENGEITKGLGGWRPNSISRIKNSANKEQEINSLPIGTRLKSGNIMWEKTNTGWMTFNDKGVLTGKKADMFGGVKGIISTIEDGDDIEIVTGQKPQAKPTKEKPQADALGTIVTNDDGRDFTEEEISKLNSVSQMLEKATKEIRELYAKGEYKFAPVVELNGEKQGAYYNPSANTVNVPLENDDYYGCERTILHECGHAIDRQKGNNGVGFSYLYKDGIFDRTLKQEVADFIAKQKDNIQVDKNSELWKEVKQACIEKAKKGKLKGVGGKTAVFDLFKGQRDDIIEKEYIKIVSKRNIDNMFNGMPNEVQDIVAGATQGKYGQGHSKKYWQQDDQLLSAEAFTEMLVCETTGEIEKIKEIFPKSYQVFKEMVGAMNG